MKIDAVNQCGVRPAGREYGREPESRAGDPTVESEACHAPGTGVETRAMRQSFELTLGRRSAADQCWRSKGQPA